MKAEPEDSAKTEKAPSGLPELVAFSSISEEALVRKHPTAELRGSTRCPGCNTDMLVVSALLCVHCRSYGINALKKDDRVNITGDDILIEYISRLMHALKAIKADSLKAKWKRGLEKFITHSVWHSSDIRRLDNNKLW